MQWIVDKRIWVDDVTFTELESFFDITRGYIKRDSIYDAIIGEWIDDEGCIKVGNVILSQSSLKRHSIWIRVSDSLWDDFKILCFRRNLDISNGFKIATYRFLDKVYKNGSILGYKLYDNKIDYYNDNKIDYSVSNNDINTDVQVKRFNIVRSPPPLGGGHI